MASFFEALGESVNRAFCSQLGNLATAGELARYIAEPVDGSSLNPFASLYAQNCPLTQPALPPGGFTGGQCPGVEYRITTFQHYKRLSPPLEGDQGQNNLAIAPISSVQFLTNYSFRDNTALRIVDANGERIIPVNPATASNNTNEWFEYTNPTVSVARTDNQPDTCGSLPSGGVPYQSGDNIYNDNITYNAGDDNDVTIPVVLAFGYAQVNIDGTISIPINANFTANPQFNANFNFNLNNGNLTPDFTDPRNPIPPGCADPSGYVPDPTIPDPPEGIGEPPVLDPPTDDPTNREKLLAACIVTVSAIDPNTTTIYQGNNPDIFAPSAGYVNFLIKVGNASGWTNDIPVKNARAFIPCPWEGGAVEVRGTPRYGGVFTITPIYYRRSYYPTFPAD